CARDAWYDYGSSYVLMAYW
nr:immunoglobulin heavy chain junction region [Macaca mulatta]MOV49282.1 immunoglobulin heavy chain junction region [Macaca mulatta]MOV49947.1 immunoglobulin heavy chain junction region [Macaca mulatta]MOV50227.1 immunoglobulin heavy chain junction region [Macaca mulatta]MOV50932.1 immunoglobulin heavy chain junction region [Macaca mulatta]